MTTPKLILGAAAALAVANPASAHNGAASDVAAETTTASQAAASVFEQRFAAGPRLGTSGKPSAAPFAELTWVEVKRKKKLKARTSWNTRLQVQTADVRRAFESHSG